jgi:hypothetical protein
MSETRSDRSALLRQQRRRRDDERRSGVWFVFMGEHPSGGFLAVGDDFVVGDRDEHREVVVLARGLRGDALARGVDDDRPITDS